MGAFTATITAVVLATVLPPVSGHAGPVLVFPGMQIDQGNNLCTLGYVDPVLRVAFTAGHCRADGAVSDKDGHFIGRLATFRENTPNGATVYTDQQVADYEAIVLADDVTMNNMLPGGRVLESEPGLTVRPGDAVCHFGIITGESCGIVERVNNGWFTMTDGVISEKGDSGGPVYVTGSGGTARIVGLFNSTWGVYLAAVSWQAISEQVREDVGAPAPA
jgi:hypothetical protein